MDKILLTGATGFLGHHLLEGLLVNNYKVIILKRSNSNTWRIQHYLDRIISYDIDKVSIEHIFKENQINVIIHAATNYGRKGPEYAEIIKSNLLLPVTLLEYAISNNVECFINTDSFFNTPSLQYRHLSYYSLSKKQLIDWLKLISGKIQIINLKLEHIYGPRDSDLKIVMWLINELRNNVPEINLTKGEQKRDFIYINDAVNAYLLMLDQRKHLGNYIEFGVGTGMGVSIKKLTLMIKQCVSNILNKEINTSLNFGAIPYKEGELMESEADNSTLKNLGWNYLISLEEGLSKTIKEKIYK